MPGKMVGPIRTKKRTADWTRILCSKALERVDELREEELAVAQELADEKGEPAAHAASRAGVETSL
jgi:hypothetical protein